MVKYDIKTEYAEKIKNWYVYDSRRLFIISGYAGCGKTTLARSIPDLLKLYRVAFLAPTGKASLLVENGKTIHSYLYNAVRDNLTEEIKFYPRDKRDFNDDLLIIDEISMVSDDIMDDLKSLDIPIIGLGDSAQLPPVSGENTILENPDIFLTEVFRNDGGILALATDVRMGNKVGYKYNDVKFISRKFISDINLLDDNSIVICKFNKTRRKINMLYRTEVMKTRVMLVEGEKLIITRNNAGSGLMNGSLVTVKGISYFLLDNRMAEVLIENDSGIKFTIRIDISQLLDEPSLDYIHYRNDNMLHEVDYAYAITCHKAQGSEFDRVFIINEGRNFDNHQAWFYTAVTRAKKEVRIYNFG